METNSRKLYATTEMGLTPNALRELSYIVENQNTTDRDEPGEYVRSDENDVEYFYQIDEDYDVTLTEIRY